ncbi:olfactory receptor 13H1-like protein [Camelus ferus]|nr:olfactory receptor 13H1-like protein [Camelus ferus]
MQRWGFRRTIDIQNSTEELYFILLGLSQYPRAQAIFFCLLLMSYIITLLGNSLVLLLICYDPQLHMRMYFFISNLSFLDMCYTMSSVPQTLINCLVTIPAISLGQCLAQMAVGLYLGVVECLLLAAMAYDCCVAIGDPLHYSVHMGPRLCGLLAGTSWTAAFLLTMVLVMTMPLEFCGYQVINHFSLVALFYGTAISMYMTPQDKTTHDRDKIISISYGILTPMMNPFIYSLRNKDVEGAFRRLLGRRTDL